MPVDVRGHAARCRHAAMPADAEDVDDEDVRRGVRPCTFYRAFLFEGKMYSAARAFFLFCRPHVQAGAAFFFYVQTMIRASALLSRQRARFQKDVQKDAVREKSCCTPQKRAAVVACPPACTQKKNARQASKQKENKSKKKKIKMRLLSSFW